MCWGILLDSLAPTVSQPIYPPIDQMQPGPLPLLCRSLNKTPNMPKPHRKKQGFRASASQKLPHARPPKQESSTQSKNVPFFSSVWHKRAMIMHSLFWTKVSSGATKSRKSKSRSSSHDEMVAWMSIQHSAVVELKVAPVDVTPGVVNGIIDQRVR